MSYLNSWAVGESVGTLEKLLRLGFGFCFVGRGEVVPKQGAENCV